jgi:hypothetical protein
LEASQDPLVKLAGLRFTAQERSEKVNVTIDHPTGYIDNDLAATCVAALQVLAVAIHAARGQENSGDSSGGAAMIEALLGYSILAYNEGRAFLLVAAAGMSRHARIHLRNLIEYRTRLDSIFADTDRAKRFWDALAHEMRVFVRKLGTTLDDSAVEKSIAEIYGNEIPIEPQGEKKVLFPQKTITSALLSGPSGKTSLAAYDWAGHFAHGSILALREVARDAAGGSSNFLNAAANDERGNDLTFRVTDLLLWFTASLTIRFMMPAELASRLDDAIFQNADAALRLNLIKQEDHQRMHDGLKAARQSSD